MESEPSVIIGLMPLLIFSVFWMFIVSWIAKTRRVNVNKFTFLALIPGVAPFLVIALLKRPDKQVLDRIDAIENILSKAET